MLVAPYGAERNTGYKGNKGRFWLDFCPKDSENRDKTKQIVFHILLKVIKYEA